MRDLGSLLAMPWAQEPLKTHAQEQWLPDWAAVGAAFFCARAAESAVVARSERVIQRMSEAGWYPKRGLDLHSRIGLLEASGLVDTRCASALHAIRRLGNEVRHAGTYPDAAQVHFSVVMLSLALPHAVGAIQACQDWLNADIDDDLFAQVRNLERGLTHTPVRNVAELKALAPDLLPAWPPDAHSRESGNPILLWVIARCIDAGHLQVAREMMSPWIGGATAPWMSSEGRQVVPIVRLAALALSRSGQAPDAVALLTPCALAAGYLPVRWHSEPDARLPTSPDLASHAAGETLGILAGAHKRIGAGLLQLQGQDELSREHFDRATRLYEALYSAQPWNPYVCINRAATLLWSGDSVRAADIAAQTLDVTDALRKAVPPNVWSDLTRAEALLIRGQASQAQLAYEAAWHRYRSSHQGALASARQQLAIHECHELTGAGSVATAVDAVSSGPPTDA